MKILVIPDIHGNWKVALQNIKNNIDKVDQVVTLGDYVDDFDDSLSGKTMIDGFTELCQMARDTKKINICIGNHDNSYYSPPRLREGVCSGHRWEYASDYKKMFDDNADLLNIFYMFDGVLFSHAGYSLEFNTRLSDRVERIEYDIKIPKTSLNVNKINKLFHYDPDLFQHCGWSPSGNSIGESFLWIRPTSLLKSKWDKKIKLQVVGHTEMGISFLQCKNKKLIVADSREHDKFLILDTEKIDELEFRQVEKKKETDEDRLLNWLVF